MEKSIDLLYFLFLLIHSPRSENSLHVVQLGQGYKKPAKEGQQIRYALQRHREGGRGKRESSESEREEILTVEKEREWTDPTKFRKKKREEYAGSKDVSEIGE